MNRAGPALRDERITWLERDGDDFPYYDGQPVALSAMQWVLVILAVVVAFFVLILAPRWFRGPVAGFVPVLLYVAIPLGALSLASRGHAGALFRKVRGRDIWLMVLFALISVAITLGVGSVLIRITETTPNAAVTSLGEQSMTDVVLTYVRSIPQLLGEELMTILPFLALLWVFRAGLRWSRVTAMVLAWLLTGLLFAAEHLSTYNWNLVQSLGGVGIVRLVLTLPYIITKNVWVSTGAHILNDWTTFSLSVLGAGLQDSSG